MKVMFHEKVHSTSEKTMMPEDAFYLFNITTPVINCSFPPQFLGYVIAFA